jgi:hypothetical protein
MGIRRHHLQPITQHRCSLSVAILIVAFVVGCAEQPMRGSNPTPWALATSTVQWNEYACDLIARNAIGQAPAFRALAYVNLAINNAIVRARSEGRDPGGAAASAAATMLVYLFPKDEQAINARLTRELAALGASPRKIFEAGAEIGRVAAADTIALAKSDRFGVAWTGTLPTGDDKWSSRAQPPQPPAGANFGQVRTFFLMTAADFRAPPPPKYDSPEFRAQVAELRKISDGRTNEQLRIAQYWEQLTGSFTSGAWNAVARNAIATHALDEAQSARVLVLMHMVMFDALVACHESKYVYWVPRPTQADPKITLAVGIPNHPSYPSNHACISGAAGWLLDSQFPDQKGMYGEMGRQAGDSRMYAGIHYRMDLDSGYDIARKVVAKALEVGVPADRPFVPMGR